MKTFQTITAAVFLLCIVFACAQTKEETIAWLKENLENNIHLENNWHLQNIEVTPCRISWLEESDQEYKYGRSSFSCSFNPLLGGNWSVDGCTMVIAEANIILSRNYSGISGLYEDHGLAVFILEKREKNLAENIAKALNQLATFCEEKESYK